MLSVVGGLMLMSSSSPLAAETHPSATRSLDSSSVEPGAIVTVTITLADDYEGNLARITERLPDGFDYVPDSVVGASFRPDASGVDNGTLVFNLFSLGGLGGDSFTYQVTASETDGPYMFEGDLIDAAQVESAIEATPITVSTDTGPAPVDAGDGLQFDVVPAKAVKGAVVSGLNSIRSGASPCSGRLRPVGRQSPLRVAVQSEKTSGSQRPLREAASSSSSLRSPERPH